MQRRRYGTGQDGASTLPQHTRPDLPRSSFESQAAERILAQGRFTQAREALREIEALLSTMGPESDAAVPALYARALLLRLLGAPRAEQVAACTMMENAAVHHGGHPHAEAWLGLAHAMRAQARLETGEAAVAMGDLARIDFTELDDVLDSRTGFRLLDTTAAAYARARMYDKVEQVRELLEDGIERRDPVDRATHWATWAAELAVRAMEPVARGADEPDQRLLERAVRIADRVGSLGMNAVPQPLARTADGVRALAATYRGEGQQALRLLGSDAFGEPSGLRSPESQLLVIASLRAHTLVGSHATARSLDDSLRRSTGSIPNIVLEICRARQRMWMERESGLVTDHTRQRLTDLLVRLAWAGMDLATETGRQAIEHQVLHTESRTDPVTGVGNRRALDEQLHAMLRFSPLPLSMVLIDVDDFKKINDDHTHVVGDEVLRALAVVLEEAAPPDARLLRYGGDEFVVLLPHTGDAEARGVATLLTQAVSEHPWERIAASLQVRITTGCSALWALTGRRPAADAERLFRRADESLLEAKRSRRPVPPSKPAGDPPPVTEVLDLRSMSQAAEAASPQGQPGNAGRRRARRSRNVIDLTGGEAPPVDGGRPSGGNDHGVDIRH